MIINPNTISAKTDPKITLVLKICVMISANIVSVTSMTIAIIIATMSPYLLSILKTLSTK